MVKFILARFMTLILEGFSLVPDECIPRVLATAWELTVIFQSEIFARVLCHICTNDTFLYKRLDFFMWCFETKYERGKVALNFNKSSLGLAAAVSSVSPFQLHLPL